ncbi:uncharacterized protein LOC110433895 [Sorghum bicolor]|uniref:uncharacterized protein LOC110433895 n=1 Tax=Sorghum bicolor TaxID=4558 RepID=UPI000B423C61|nr:uncharacterized protein LOC110433895 [Sorghum bicolor]|eukprot:XP_021312589.1 uncharacterized protein LOC110433895 [Sorghum bicolor]
MIRAVGYDHCIALYISRSASATTPNPKSFPPCSRSRFAQCLSRSRSLLSSLPPAPTTMAKGDDASNGGGRQRLAAGPTSSSRPPDAQELRRTISAELVLARAPSTSSALSSRLRPGQAEARVMPRPPPSVSEDTVEASATAMEEEMERICDLRGNSDDDDMAEDGLVPGPARALACHRA